MKQSHTSLGQRQAVLPSLDCFYRNSLEAFLRMTNEDKVVVETVLEGLPTFAPRVFERVRRGQPLRMLDIGGGPGTKTFSLLQSLVRDGAAKILLTNIDPCAEWCSRYRTEARSHGLESSIEAIHCVRWEEYESKELYDFVFCSHSLYGVTGWSEIDPDHNTLCKMRRILRPRGVVCIVVQSAENAIYRVQKKILRKIYDDVSIVCGRDVEHVLNLLGIKNFIVSDVPEFLDASFLYDDSTMSPRLRIQVLSLMLLVPEHVYEGQPEELKEEAEEYLRKLHIESAETNKLQSSEEGGPQRSLAINDDFLWIENHENQWRI